MFTNKFVKKVRKITEMIIYIRNKNYDDVFV